VALVSYSVYQVEGAPVPRLRGPGGRCRTAGSASTQAGPIAKQHRAAAAIAAIACFVAGRLIAIEAWT
jgi:hypothetical protein